MGVVKVWLPLPPLVKVVMISVLAPVVLERPQADKKEDLATINARLTMQIRGLVMQLSDAQTQLSERDLMIKRLKDELDTARSALERAVRKG